MEYNVDYFIGKFSAIPEDRWTTGTVRLVTDSGNVKHCAFGHCGITADDTWDHFNREAKALNIMFETNALTVVQVNDNNGGTFGAHKYTQATPKQRILAALEDIKAKQVEQVREKTVYVTVTEQVKELAAEEACLS